MIDSSALSTAVETQRRCYRFLQLIKNDRLELTGGWAIRGLHDDSTTEAERFKELVLAHFETLPENARPVSSGDADTADFANFFVSYLICSFDVVDDPRFVQLDHTPVEDASCWCELCARLTGAPNLKLKKITGRDQGIADSLEAEAVRLLVEAENLSIAPEKTNELLKDGELRETRALVAYGIELVRRCRGETVDSSSLVLWRRFAWQNGIPKRGFVLSAELIETAERGLAARLKTLAGI